MKEALEIRARAAEVALAALVERQAEDIPWHYGAQVKKMKLDLVDLKWALNMDPANSERLDPDALLEGIETVIPWGPGELEGLIFDRHRQVTETMSALVSRLRSGPIARPEIVTAVAELEPLLVDLNAEGFRLESEWHRRKDREGGQPWGHDWPQGINPTHDDLDLGRKY